MSVQSTRRSFLLQSAALVGSAYLPVSGLALAAPPRSKGTWAFQCVDTMKTSRDPSREPITEARLALMRSELSLIKGLGATHVAISTPYDMEFRTFLRTWVREARAHGLKVWYRGNWCAWEGWYGYPKWMDTYDKHVEATVDFLRGHPELFEDGDAFTSCPEAENAALEGDPRATGRAEDYRRFLRDTYDATNRAFADMRKKVHTNWFSMNGDIGRDILDRATVEHIGGLVTIDHYVRDVATMIRYVDDIHEKYGCKVMIGEFGAPLVGIDFPKGAAPWPPQEQARFVEEILAVLAKRDYVVGVNYWVGAGLEPDTTRLFDIAGDACVPRPVANVVRGYFGGHAG